MRLPRWHWAYTVFRLADGLTHAVLPLVGLLRLDMPAWSVAATIAAMNLASVPAAFVWAAVTERRRGAGRRRLAVAGFTIAALGMILAATATSFAVLLTGAVVLAMFGVATGPASSVLLLESVPGKQWSEATSGMARTTGIAYLSGIIASTAWGLSGTLDTRLALGAGAVLCIGAAAWAARTIDPFVKPVRGSVESLGVRRFERPVWLPMRLRHWPTLAGLKRANGHPLVLLWVVGLTFMGSTVFFASYAGLLARDVGLGVGLVLLAQSPSQFVTPYAAPWSGRMGGRHGELRVVGVALIIRLIALQALIIGMVGQGAAVLWLLLPAHALIGLGFSMLQVNGACLMARVHRGGRGQGVGAYHLAVGVGSLAGSLVAFLLFAWVPVAVLFATSMGLALAGGVLYLRIRNSSQFVDRNDVTPEASAQ